MSSIATPTDNAALGQRLIVIRATTRLSQGAFAEVLGLSHRAYANYERGEREMPVAVFRALYDAYGIDPIWLLEGSGEQPVKAAERTMDFTLVEEIIACVDAELAMLGRRLRPRQRRQILKAAYAYSAKHGRVERDHVKQLVAVGCA